VKFKVVVHQPIPKEFEASSRKEAWETLEDWLWNQIELIEVDEEEELVKSCRGEEISRNLKEAFERLFPKDLLRLCKELTDRTEFEFAPYLACGSHEYAVIVYDVDDEVAEANFIGRDFILWGKSSDIELNKRVESLLMEELTRLGYKSLTIDEWEEKYGF